MCEPLKNCKSCMKSKNRLGPDSYCTEDDQNFPANALKFCSFTKDAIPRNYFTPSLKSYLKPTIIDRFVRKIS